jgi:hypothetical protein
MIKTILIWVLIATGTASQYAPAKFQEPIYNRTHGLAAPAVTKDPTAYDGWAAARYPEDIDKVWLVCPLDTELPCRELLVVDCAKVSDGTLTWMKTGNVVLEIDYETAVAWDTVSYGIKVRVYEQRQYYRPIGGMVQESTKASQSAFGIYGDDLALRSYCHKPSSVDFRLHVCN